MKLNCQVRQASSNLDAKHYDTKRLREEYLVERLMVPDEINMVYSMFDRILCGGAVPVKEDLLLSAPEILRADYFTQRREGKIINICSMMSELGRETVSAYAAAKGGLKMLTRNICSEYGEYNIQCNGIGPGYIATPQTAPLRERQPDGSRHPFDSFICAKTPAGRWLDPSELGGPAVFLASHASDAVNGHILYVDGGILAYIGKQPK